MWVSSQDRTPPATTSLTYAASATAFNQVTVKLSSAGTFTIFKYGGTADVIIDVMGFYGPLTTSTYACNGDGGIYSGMLGAGSLTTDTINAVPW
jgi:hypothetical protein